MQVIKRGLVDLSSVIWTSLLYGKDTENGIKAVDEGGKEILNTKGEVRIINSAVWGYENVMQELTRAMRELDLTPHQLIIVMEGKGAKMMRQAIHPEYKAGRDKLPQQYEQFNICKEMVMQALLNVGANVCWQDGGVEADDVIGYLAQNLKGYRYIISGDKDLAQLVGPGPNDCMRIHGSGFKSSVSRGHDDSGWDGYVHHYRSGVLDENPFGPFSHRFIPVAIATLGDSVDKIPGAKGFGPQAFKDLLVAFGDEGLEELEKLIKTDRLGRLAEDVGELKALQKIIDDQAGVKKSYTLGMLHTHRVNISGRPLQWRVGVNRTAGPDIDERLRRFGGRSRIVPAEKFQEALDFFQRQVARSPFVTLDIETSTPPESDAWLESLGKDEDKTPVDVFGSFITSVQLTFGDNLQHSLYLPVKNNGTDGISNLTIEQVATLVDAIPHEMYTYVHNASFEMPVCYMEWGQLWKDDPTWHGFLRNVLDTRIGASYVDENESAGLKKLSRRLMGYEQTSYDEVTTKVLPAVQWDGQGRLLQRYTETQTRGTGQFQDRTEVTVSEDGTDIVTVFPGEGPEILEEFEGPEMVRVQYKMDQLSATEAMGYGCDDTICTAALAVWQRIIMELEQTWDQYIEVEQLPAYTTSKAFVDGVPFSRETMAQQEREDDKTYDEAWAILREYLIKVGFDGVHPPVYQEIDAGAIKEAYEIVTGRTLETRVRTPSKMLKLIQQEQQALEDLGDDDAAVVDLFQATLAKALEDGVEVLNNLVSSKFDGEPKIDLASPKQMTRLLYDVMKLPIKIVNPCTPTEKEKKPELAEAVKRFSWKRAGKSDVVLTEADMALVRQKAQANDTAIDTALAFDMDVIGEESAEALRAIKAMKTVMTRRSLFYKTYWSAPHWKDGKIHASVNQCGTVTRRYSASNPNITQLPKLGEGVKFRRNFRPHHRDAVVCSADFSGQELRIAAERSQDKNLLSCYVGDQLRDVHSITASGAMTMKWGKTKVAELVEKFGKDLPMDDPDYWLFDRLRALGKKDPAGKMADDLRKVAKNVNFGSIYLAKPPTLADTLIMTLEDATVFLNARNERFAGLNEAAERAERECLDRGYSLTMMGARRHLEAAINSGDRGMAARAARQAWNFEIQGSAAEMTKLALGRLWKSGILFKLDMVFYFPVHDELVWSVSRGHAAESMRVVNQCMTAQYADMQVPILASLSLGANYADQIECGDFFDQAAIEAALNDVFAQKEAA